MTSKLVDGFNEDIPNDVYHGDRKYVSSSALKMILEDPRKYHQVYVLGEQVDQMNMDALNIGSYIHALILEPHVIESEFALFPKVMRRGEDWEKFQAENIDKIIITKNQHLQAKDLVSNFENTNVVVGYEV